MTRAPVTKIVVTLALGAALAALVFAAVSPPPAGGAPGVPVAPSVAVETVPLMEQTLADTVSGFGSVTTTEEAIADVSFLHAGQIARLHVRPGQTVRAGDPGPIPGPRN